MFPTGKQFNHSDWGLKMLIWMNVLRLAHFVGYTQCAKQVMNDGYLCFVSATSWYGAVFSFRVAAGMVSPSAFQLPLGFCTAT